MQIFIKANDLKSAPRKEGHTLRTVYTINIDNTETCAKLKEIILQTIQIPIRIINSLDLRLDFAGRNILNTPNDTLESKGIKNESTLTYRVFHRFGNNNSKSTIFISGMTSGYLTFPVNISFTTIGALRQKIANRLHGINPDNISLIWAGKHLDLNKYTLADYGIQKDSTLSLSEESTEDY